MMSKYQLLFLLFLFHAVYTQTQLFSESSCFRNCIQCPSEKPLLCSFNNAITEPSRNRLCFPFFQGRNCDQISSGAYVLLTLCQKVNENNLKAWSRKTSVCEIDGTAFEAVGPLNDSNSMEATLNIDQNNLQFLMFKFSFLGNISEAGDVLQLSQTISENNQQSIFNSVNNVTVTENLEDGIKVITETITTTTTQSGQTLTAEGASEDKGYKFANVQINEATFSKDLLLYATKNPTSISKTSCGTSYHFIYYIQFPVPLNKTTITITIQNAVPQNYMHLVSLDIYGGCNGFTISSGQARCDNCLSGFYQVRNTDKSLAACKKCDSGCLTCSTNGDCTSCSKETTFDEKTKKCVYSSNYNMIKTFTIVKGRDIKSNDDVFHRPVYTQQNSIILNVKVQSISSYGIRFYFLFTEQFLNQSKGRQIVVYEGNNKILKTISITQNLNQNLGTFYQNINGGTQKVYIYIVEIDHFSSEIHFSNNKYLNIGVKTASPTNQALTSAAVNSFGISNFQIISFLCSHMCADCNSALNTCSSCRSFFDINSNCQYCPNGYFNKKYWEKDKTVDGIIIPSTKTTEPDMCVKCHVTCKQCNGESLSNCKDCYSGFVIKDVIYDHQCIQCLYNKNKKGQQPAQCKRCLQNYEVKGNSLCSQCLNKNKLHQVTSDEGCEKCWIKASLASGRCVPSGANDFVFYGTDAIESKVDEGSWKGFINKKQATLQKFNCTKEYENLWGFKPNPNTKDNQAVIEWKENNLPPHRGLSILMNVIKIDNWETDKNKENNSIKIIISSGNSELFNKSLVIKNEFGSNICQGEGNEMFFTFQHTSVDHNIKEGENKQIRIVVTGTGDGLAIRQLQVYLGECETCLKNELSYQIGFLPRYMNNETQTGLDIFLSFNEQVQYFGSDKELQNAFSFTIDKIGKEPLLFKDFKNDLENNNRLKYFIPIDQGFIAGWLTANTTQGQKIFSDSQPAQRLLLTSRLNNPQSQESIDRYSNVNLDDRYSMNQIFWFFVIFQWIALIGMIISAFCGVGIIMEDFCILLQIIFLHVYISSPLLPATFKAPLSGLQQMENLNYFIEPHAQSIEAQWFGNYINPSPFIFEQYNVDNFFLRSFYPTIIINLIYLIWFLLLLAINKFVKGFRDSNSNIVRFFKNIPQRPINYFDQIWRYQFLTTIWAAFIQFYSLRTETSFQKINFAICIVAFVITIIWLFFIIIYTYQMTKVKYVSNFIHQYEDIFFKKIATFGQENSRYYLYIGVRFARYFFIALFIAFFIEHQIIGPVILIVVNIIQIVYVLMAKIYISDYKAACMKITQNVLFIAFEIMFLFVYGFSNSMNDNDFLNLGFSMIVVSVLMVINGTMRFLYYGYEKGRSFYYNAYGEDAGEKKTYKNTPLPTSQKFEAASN